MQKENWKPIDRTKGMYSVSDLGRIRSNERCIIKSDGKVQFVSERIRKLVAHCTGYSVVSLCKVTYRVHRLVAEAFIQNPEDKPFVNHINGIKTDNRVENLEWVTESENTDHAVLSGLFNVTGVNNPACRLTRDDVHSMFMMYVQGCYMKDIAKEYHVDRNSVARLLKIYYGYIMLPYKGSHPYKRRSQND